MHRYVHLLFLLLLLTSCAADEAIKAGTSCDETCPVGAQKISTKEAHGSCGGDGTFNPESLEVSAGGRCVGSGECQVVCLYPKCGPDQTLSITAEEFRCEAGPDPCAGEECSGHGRCRNNNGQAICDCDEGYVADGLQCIEKRAYSCTNFCERDKTCNRIDNFGSVDTCVTRCEAEPFLQTDKNCAAHSDCPTFNDCVRNGCSGCLIDDRCYDDGDRKGEFGHDNCKVCDLSKRWYGWTLLTSREVCDDSDPCTYEDRCDSEGLCGGEGYTCSEEGTECDGEGGCRKADEEPIEPDYAITSGYTHIPKGAFVMGSPDGERCPPDNPGCGTPPSAEPNRLSNERQFHVTLTYDFEIMIREASQSDFEHLMGYNPSYYSECEGASPRNCPVENVNWFEAVAYANKTSTRLGYEVCYQFREIECADGTPDPDADYCSSRGGITDALEVTLNSPGSVYDCEGFRLPTEAEWEYAARAGSRTAIYSGENPNKRDCVLEDALTAIAWYCYDMQQHGETTYSRGGKLANSFGLHDMLGNVEEWVWDWYAEDYPEAVAQNPQGPSIGVQKVSRGCSWQSSVQHCRTAYRGNAQPFQKVRSRGVRLVRTLR